jgi:hypothetical protein
LGLTAASLLSCIALALTPAGRVKFVTRMVCGIVCALAMVAPVLELDIDSLAVGMASYSQRAQSIIQSEEESAKMQERTYIEEQCGAYILAKAAKLEAQVSSAAVQARWDDEALVWVPWQVTVAGAYNEALAQAIETELGIPAQRQEWEADG